MINKIRRFFYRVEKDRLDDLKYDLDKWGWGYIPSYLRKQEKKIEKLEKRLERLNARL